MTQEQYRARKLEELNKLKIKAAFIQEGHDKTFDGEEIECVEIGDIKAFLSQTIDELWFELPAKIMIQPAFSKSSNKYAEGVNDAIAEAERMRDKQIKETV